jgi:Zn-dependent protease
VRYGINPLEVILWFIVFLFSLSVHESSHAFVSDRFGDDLGRMMGRNSLNPMAHIDPIGTVLFPLMGALFSIPVFGWAKPVPVNPLAWREKDKANFWVSAAGPLSNFALAVIFFVILKILLVTGLAFPKYDSLLAIATGRGVMEPIAMLVSIGLTVNLMLGIFNLFPIPPLDGSKMLHAILPYEAQKGYEQIEQYGFVLLFLLVFVGAVSYVYVPVVLFVARLLGIH